MAFILGGGGGIGVATIVLWKWEAVRGVGVSGGEGGGRCWWSGDCNGCDETAPGEVLYGAIHDVT